MKVIETPISAMNLSLMTRVFVEATQRMMVGQQESVMLVSIIRQKIYT